MNGAAQHAHIETTMYGLVCMQHCPPGRFLMLLAVATLVYLTGLTPLRQMLQRLANVNLAQPGPGAAAGGGANQPAFAAPRHWSFLAELQAVVVGFISSLIPGQTSPAFCSWDPLALVFMPCTP